LKKTQNDPKKTRQRRSLEENETRRKRRFTPAESMHFQLGGHRPQPSDGFFHEWLRSIEMKIE